MCSISKAVLDRVTLVLDGGVEVDRIVEDCILANWANRELRLTLDVYLFDDNRVTHWDRDHR